MYQDNIDAQLKQELNQLKVKEHLPELTEAMQTANNTRRSPSSLMVRTQHPSRSIHQMTLSDKTVVVCLLGYSEMRFI